MSPESPELSLSLVSVLSVLESPVSVSPLSLDPSSLDSPLPVSEEIVPDSLVSVPFSPESLDSAPPLSVPSDSDPVPADPEVGLPVTLNGVSLVKAPTLVADESEFGVSPQALGMRFGSCSPVSGLIPTCCSSVGLPFALVPSAMPCRRPSRLVMTLPESSLELCVMAPPQPVLMLVSLLLLPLPFPELPFPESELESEELEESVPEFVLVESPEFESEEPELVSLESDPLEPESVEPESVEPSSDELESVGLDSADPVPVFDSPELDGMGVLELSAPPFRPFLPVEVAEAP